MLYPVQKKDFTNEFGVQQAFLKDLCTVHVVYDFKSKTSGRVSILFLSDTGIIYIQFTGRKFYLQIQMMASNFDELTYTQKQD